MAFGLSLFGSRPGLNSAITPSSTVYTIRVMTLKITKPNTINIRCQSLMPFILFALFGSLYSSKLDY